MIKRFTLLILLIIITAALCDTYLDGVKPPYLPVDVPEIDLAKIGDGDDGFTEIPENILEKRDYITILMPKISSESGRYRAKILLTALDKHDISYKEAETVELDFSSETDRKLQNKIDLIMKDELPIVILNNKIKANPSIEEVLRQYNKKKNELEKPEKKD